MLLVLHCTHLNFTPSNNLHFLVQTYIDNLSRGVFYREDIKYKVNTDESMHVPINTNKTNYSTNAWSVMLLENVGK